MEKSLNGLSSYSKKNEYLCRSIKWLTIRFFFCNFLSIMCLFKFFKGIGKIFHFFLFQMSPFPQILSYIFLYDLFYNLRKSCMEKFYINDEERIDSEYN